MAVSITQYRAAVRKSLRCCRSAEDRLLAKLDRLLETYAEEQNQCDNNDLIVAFGSPEDLAAILMQDITPEEQAQYRTRRRITQVILSILAAVFLAFTVWLYFFKEVGLTTQNIITIDDENIESTYTFTEDDTP